PSATRRRFVLAGQGPRSRRERLPTASTHQPPAPPVHRGGLPRSPAPREPPRPPPGNEPFVDQIRPETSEDWLIVAGDVAERMGTVVDTLARLRERFATVVWVPGNHELWTTAKDPDQHRGEERYRELVDRCRGIDVVTPEDEFPVWPYADKPLTVAPLFLLYDYSWRTPRAEVVPLSEALRQAREAGVVCTDEYLLHPDPYPSRQKWCSQRLEYSEKRLVDIPSDHGTVLVSHWPLHRHPTEPLYYPEFALWCGTEERSEERRVGEGGGTARERGYR